MGLQLARLTDESWMSPTESVSSVQRKPSWAVLRPQNRQVGGVCLPPGPGTSGQRNVELMRGPSLPSIGYLPFARSAPSAEAFRPRGDRQQAGVEDFHIQQPDPNVASTLYPVRASIPPGRSQPMIQPQPSRGTRRPRGTNSIPEGGSAPQHSGDSDSEADQDPYRDALAAEIALAEKTIREAEEKLSRHYPGQSITSLLERGTDESRHDDERLLRIQRKTKEAETRLERLGRAWHLPSDLGKDMEAEETNLRQHCGAINQLLQKTDDPWACRAQCQRGLRLLVRHEEDPSSNPLVKQYVRIIRQKAKEIKDQEQQAGRIAEKEERQQAAGLLVSLSGATEAISRRDSSGGSVAGRSGGGVSSSSERAAKVSAATSVPEVRACLGHRYVYGLLEIVANIADKSVSATATPIALTTEIARSRSKQKTIV